MKIREVITAIVLLGLMTKVFSQENSTEINAPFSDVPCISEGYFNFSSTAFNISVNTNGYMTLVDADSNLTYVPSKSFNGDDGFDPDKLSSLIDGALSTQSTMLYESAGTYSLVVEGVRGIQAIYFTDSEKEQLSNAVYEFEMFGTCGLVENQSKSRPLATLEKKEEVLSVYPTFVTDNVTVKSEGVSSVNVVNSNGELVLFTSFSDFLSIDVSSFATGTYMVKTSEGTSTFIVQR